MTYTQMEIPFPTTTATQLEIPFPKEEVKIKEGKIQDQPKIPEMKKKAA